MQFNCKKIIKPMLNILAGIPTIIYGYFAATILAPLIKKIGEIIGLNIEYENAFIAGIAMGIMIIPYIFSIIYEVFSALPNNLRDAALALGSTKAETINQVLFPAAKPAILSVILLSISRAIGETMIVAMAAGFQANLTFNPFSSVTTITAQIVSLIMGDQEFNSPKSLAAFALALILFIVTFTINIVSNRIILNYKMRYKHNG